MELKAGDHVHLMGICGTAMGSLAGLLTQKGFKVTGSDANVYPPMSTQLRDLGIEIKEGYGPENLKPRPDGVVVGNVIRKANPEAVELLSSDIPYTSLPSMMGDYVIGSRDSYVISGTHGKTTTTALLAWVTETLGLKPGFMVGGIPVNFKRSFEFGEGNVFVIEGDEYDTAFFDKVPKFVHYRPKYVALTSVEFDHVDIYANMEGVRDAFRKLVELTPNDGLLVHYGESDEVLNIVSPYGGAKVSYGISKGDLTVPFCEMSEKGMRFRVQHGGQDLGVFETQLFGRHNLLNHLAVLGFAVHLGWDLEAVRRAFETFKGVKRRQEVLGSPGGVWVIEDFAHHPTAVGLTIESMRERFPSARIFSLFEPRSATSRRSVFQDDYLQAFLRSHDVYIAPPFNKDQIPQAEQFSSEKLVRGLLDNGVRAKVLSPDEMVQEIKVEARSGDVVLIMSNGAFDGIYSKILKALS